MCYVNYSSLGMLVGVYAYLQLMHRDANVYSATQQNMYRPFVFVLVLCCCLGFKRERISFVHHLYLFKHELLD